jgi:hypothetical protein
MGKSAYGDYFDDNDDDDDDDDDDDNNNNNNKSYYTIPYSSENFSVGFVSNNNYFGYTVLHISWCP